MVGTVKVMTDKPGTEAAARRRTAWFAGGMVVVFILALLLWAGPDPEGFAAELGLGAGIPVVGWLAAGAVAVAYTTYTLWAVPEIRPVVTEVSWLRLLAVPLAVGSGLIEEMFFRHFLMSWFAAVGVATWLQVFASALLFAAVHTVWAVFGGSWRALPPILLSTFALGVLMSLVYLAADRVVLPAVLAHIAINLVIEPGLLLSSVRRRTRSGSYSTSPRSTR